MAFKQRDELSAALGRALSELEEDSYHMGYDDAVRKHVDYRRGVRDLANRVCNDLVLVRKGDISISDMCKRYDVIVACNTDHQVDLHKVRLHL